MPFAMVPWDPQNLIRVQFFHNCMRVKKNKRKKLVRIGMLIQFWKHEAHKNVFPKHIIGVLLLSQK